MLPLKQQPEVYNFITLRAKAFAPTSRCTYVTHKDTAFQPFRARIRDLVEQELSSADSIDEVAMCAYGVGDGVLLQQPSRRQKRMPPYEAGWRVLKVVSGSTVVIGKCGCQDTVVNVQSIKLNPAPSLPAADVAADTTELEVQPHDDQAEYAVELEPLAAPASPPPPPIWFAQPWGAECTCTIPRLA